MSSDLKRVTLSSAYDETYADLPYNHAGCGRSFTVEAMTMAAQHLHSNVFYFTSTHLQRHSLD